MSRAFTIYAVTSRSKRFSLSRKKIHLPYTSPTPISTELLLPSPTEAKPLADAPRLAGKTSKVPLAELEPGLCAA